MTFLVQFQEQTLTISERTLVVMVVGVLVSWWASMNAASGPCTMPTNALGALRHAHI